MFRPYTYSDDAGRDTTQHGKSFQQPEEHGHLCLLFFVSFPFHNPPLHHDLQPLDDPGRKSSPVLYLLQHSHRNILFFGQWLIKNISCGHRILNSKIDPYSAYRRHRMRRIPNTKQPLRIPFFQMIDGNSQQFNFFPIG